MNNKWVKVGTIKKSKKGVQYLSLGTVESKYDPHSVELIVKNSKGEVVSKVENPMLSIQNPRKRKGITEEQASRIPEFLLADVTLPPTKS